MDTLYGCNWMDLMWRAWRCRIGVADKLDLNRYSSQIVLHISDEVPTGNAYK